jgi:hypothetical protein
MKTIVFISFIFFLLGLKLSNIINLPGKVEAVDTIITGKIIQSKPAKALPLFSESETEEQAKTKTETENQKTTNQSKPEEVN